MPHCWCEPRKEVQPNGDIIIIHNYDMEKTTEQHIKEIREQQALTNMAVKALAEMVESGEWQGATEKVVKIMLDE